MFMDAWQDAEHDFSVVNRPYQNNETQHWISEIVGFIYEIQQVSSQRYLDAYQSQQHDWTAVTRLHQTNETQHWIVMPASGGTWTIQQLSNRRFLDAYQYPHPDTPDQDAYDYAAVTRENQNNNTQRWLITEV
jgi:hypothetical protein